MLFSAAAVERALSFAPCWAFPLSCKVAVRWDGGQIAYHSCGHFPPECPGLKPPASPLPPAIAGGCHFPDYSLLKNRFFVETERFYPAWRQFALLQHEVHLKAAAATFCASVANCGIPIAGMPENWLSTRIRGIKPAWKTVS
jgi:hypothetical protein